MKTSMKFKAISLAALLAAALAAPVLAQGGPGMGGGPCMQNGGPGGGGPGMGPGGRGGRAMMYDQSNTRGWSLMTPEERSAFQKQMREVKTYDECVAVQTAHRGAMEVRAKEQGTTLPTPRRNGCDKLKARGLIK